MAVSYQSSSNQPQPKVRFEWINESWQLFSARAGVWILAGLIAFVILAAVGGGGFAGFGMYSQFVAMSRVPTDRFFIYAMPGYWVIALVANLLSAFFQAGLMRMANAEVRRQPVEVGMLFSGGSAFLPMLVLVVIFNVCNFVFNLINPLLTWLPLLFLTPLFVPAMPLIADGVQFGDALSRGWQVIKSDYFMGVVLTLAFGLLIFLGCIPCFLGLFAVYPMGYLILALLYRDMIGMPIAESSNPTPNVTASAQPGVWPPPPGAQQPPPPPSPANSGEPETRRGDATPLP